MTNKITPIFTDKSVTVGTYTIGMRSNDSINTTTIILVHGIGVSEKYFRRLAYELASTYTVISLNLPGYGETKKPARALDLDELAEILLQFIDQENIVKPILIGQSMGCQIVARLAARQGGKINKIILISPTINKDERTAPLQFFRLLQDGLREPFNMNILMVSDYLKFGILRYLRTQRYMIADKIEASLSACSQPILIIRGSRDKIVPREWATSLHQTLKTGSLVEIEGAPHNLQFTHPVEVAKACIDFIEA